MKKIDTNFSKPSQQQLNSLLKYYQAGRYSDVEKLSISITKEFPEHPFAWKVLAVVLNQNGKISEALVACQKSTQLEPGDSGAHNNLGNTLKLLGRLVEAEASYRQAIALKPDYADAHYNLGITLKELGKLEKAEESYRQAIALKPNYAKAHNNLGNLLKQPGRFDEALASFNKAIEIDVNYSNAYSNKNLCLNYSSLWPSLFIYKQHLEFEKQFGRLKTESSLNLLFKKDLTERLRIGYVSADFRKHSVAFFLSHFCKIIIVMS